MLFKKNFLLFIYFTFFLTSTFCQNTYVPDDNFEQFLIDSGYDSGPLDDYVPTNNINNITNLSISGNANYIWEIQSIQGIEDFIALEKLTIDLNEVVTLDFSSNPNLKELEILNDTLLENLNISNNTELEILHCVNTSLQTIDLTNNIKLKDLLIGNTSIIDINLIHNINLERVDITHSIIENINLKNGNNTNIIYFNIEGLFNLNCIRVDNTNYSVTNWTNIDDNSVYSETCGSFQQLTYVPDDNFEQELINLGYDSGPLNDYVLTSNINTIIELNLSNLNISDLTGIQDFIALESLNCGSNNLFELNITNNINLIDLFTGANPISQLNVSNNVLLEQLDISSTNINNIDLSNNVLINFLNIYNNNFTEVNLDNNIELTYFYCNNNNINGILDLSNNIRLFEISCSNNPITEINLPQNNILDGLHVNGTLISELDLRNQSNLISHPASFLEIQDNPNLTCVYVDDVDYYNNDPNESITKDSHTTFVSNEAECRALSCTVNVDEFDNIETCNSYTLPNITSGNYYTQSEGNGNLLNPGDIITTSQTIYIYEVDTTDNNCFDESSFEIIIHNTPNVDSLNNVEVCGSYILPNITDGNYFTEPNGNGNQLNSGHIITSSQIIYIYKSNGSCYNETNFEIIINEIPEVDILLDVETTSSYELPNLANGNYYTETNGNGNQLNSGNIITSSQTIFIYNENPNNPSCYNESSFNITITNYNLKIPSFITPNSDGYNDVWLVYSTKPIKEINIFNRFGKLIANPKINEGWDGTYNGTILSPNTYWYQIIFEDNSIITGPVAIIK